jgi:hypothetical protein
MSTRDLQNLKKCELDVLPAPFHSSLFCSAPAANCRAPQFRNQPQPNMTTETAPHSDGYLLLFRDGKWYERQDLGLDEIRQIVEGVHAWFDKLQREGKWGGGQPLFDRATTISGENGRSVTDGPFPEAKESIGGYVILKVNSFEEAVEIARGNPMLKYGLVTEVREIASDCPGLYRARQRLAAADLAEAVA